MEKPKKIQVHHWKSLRKMCRKALVQDVLHPGSIQIIRTGVTMEWVGGLKKGEGDVPLPFL